MKNIFLIALCSITLFSSSLLSSIQTFHAKSHPDNLSRKVEETILHVNKSISKASQRSSKLSKEVLSLRGMSNAKVRHLLNNLCNKENTRYLEIGVWLGSTWISALYGNESNIDEAIAIDDWSKFDGPKDAFLENSQNFLPGYPYRVYSEDSFTLDLSSSFSFPVNVYFYDGCHTEECQEMALTYFDPVLDDVFIFVVDDWSRVAVRAGTLSGIKKMGYKIASQHVLTKGNGWWNGIFVAVLVKKK